MIIKNNAFTLAEVLITLAIIGIVAAMTLISLHNKTNSKELHVAFLKTYSELNQIAQMFYAENGISFPEWGSSQAHSAAMIKLMSYYKGVVSLTSTGMGTKNDDGDYVAYYDMHLLNGESFSGGANSQGKNSSFICDNSGFKSNISGALFLMNDVPSQGDNGPVLCVDVNGRKGPNRYGLDYFLFIFTVDGYVIPMGQSHDNNTANHSVSDSGGATNFSRTGSEYCDNTSSSIAYNTTCAYYALKNIHPTENGKDYWNDFIGEVYRR